MNRTRVLGLLLGILVFTACDRDSRTGDGEDAQYADIPVEDRYGGTAVVAAIGDIPDVNPLTATDHTAAQIRQFVLFMPLVQYDENFQPTPNLARSWEVSPDTSMLTFHLRDDVYWHDGVKTTAYDLKFAYDLALDPETAFPNTAFWTSYGEAEAVDSFTFRIAMRPHAEYLDPWRSFTPVPQHILKGVAPSELRNHPFSTRSPLGNGPFRFAGRQQGQSWTFEANEDFPQELGGRPFLDRIVFRSIPEPSTLLTELLTGRVDYYIQPTPEQAVRIDASDGVRLLTFPDRAFVILGWNQRRPMFADARVRRALTMAIDREAIVDGIVYGFGEVANSTVPPFFWQHNPDAGSDLGYDPEEARRLLAEAGWTPGADGILRNPEGQQFSFTALTNHGNQERMDILQKVQSDLRQVGVVMQPQALEWGTLLDRINNPERRDFDAVLIGWVTEFRIDDEDLFHCEKRQEPFQWVGHCNPALDRYLETLPRMMDRDEARPLWHEYQQLLAQDQPYTFLYFQERREGVGNRLRGVDPDARGDWVGATEWWILPSARRGGGATTTTD